VTEIPDLGALFGQQPRQMTGAEKAAAEEAHQRQHREQEQMVSMMAHWAPLLCSCEVWPSWPRNTRPPQEDCMIHGHVMMNACTGHVYLPGQPPPEGDEH
jgi:hypothetical protein